MLGPEASLFKGDGTQKGWIKDMQKARNVKMAEYVKVKAISQKTPVLHGS